MALVAVGSLLLIAAASVLMGLCLVQASACERREKSDLLRARLRAAMEPSANEAGGADRP